MNEKFEDYLADQFAKDDPIAFGMSNNDPGPFDDWLVNMDVEQMIAYAQAWGDELGLRDNRREFFGGLKNEN